MKTESKTTEFYTPELRKLVYGLPETRELLGLSDTLTRRYLLSGELKGYKVGSHWRVSRDEILRFAKEGPAEVAV